MARLQMAGMALAFVLLGGVAYYTYTVAGELSQRNSDLAVQITNLQANITKLQDELASAGTIQKGNSQQIANAEQVLQDEQSQLALLSQELAQLKTDNATATNRIDAQLKNISASVGGLKSTFQSMPPPIFLRTEGTALASYIEGQDELTYLRLTISGPTSIAEAAIGSEPFNATVAGSFVEWKAVANYVASDTNHYIWPMVLENSPGGTNAIEFEDVGGSQEVAVVANGTRHLESVSWDPNMVNTFKIVIVTPGQEVDF